MSSLQKAAQTALEVCMGLNQKEKILIIYDNKKKILANSLAKEAKKITKKVKLLKIPESKVDGQEPSKKTANEMLKHNVIMMVTSKSLSHTNARRKATKKGIRIASMPGITKDMFLRTMKADYNKIEERTNKISNLLTKGKKVKITTKKGTNITMNIKGRRAEKGALIRKKGNFKNLPSGEACLGPLEGTTNGIFVVDCCFLEKVDKPIRVKVKNGYAIEIKGGKSAKKLIKMLESIHDKDAYAIAELGIGTNDKAKITGNLLEDEKVFGTAHIALGNNISYGGKINVPIHLDGVFNKPTIFIDNKKIIDKGKLII